jgi:hypothetical protein
VDDCAAFCDGEAACSSFTFQAARGRCTISESTATEIGAELRSKEG